MDKLFNIDASVDSAIRETERYYREQIFSSGCSSLVPIYRIGDHTTRVETLMQQFQGSPYIQKGVVFSERVIDTLLDVNLYRYDIWHFFFQGDMQGELQQFVEEQCEALANVSHVVQQHFEDSQPSWSNFQNSASILASDFPLKNGFPLDELIQQTMTIIRDLRFHHSVESYLEIFHQPVWQSKVRFDHASLMCMLAVGNALHWDDQKLRALVTLGFVKDIGYARLNEQMDNFEVLHPLVSHKILVECNELCEADEKIDQQIIDATLVHHEFSDMSGPLARMRHPMVMQLIGPAMPEIAQVSGLSDLFFGFLKDYSSGVAYAITCGFVIGQGDLDSRYQSHIIRAFSEVIQNGAYSADDIDSDEAEKLVNDIIGLLKDSKVRDNTCNMVYKKSPNWYERITLSLNIVRNIAKRQPHHLSEDSLIGVLQLPLEFGLNY